MIGAGIYEVVMRSSSVSVSQTCRLTSHTLIFRFGKMNIKKRKIKYATIFFICWFVLLVFLVDGVLKFQTLVDYFGSYVLVEISLLLLVILPTWAVYEFTKEK